MLGPSSQRVGYLTVELMVCAKDATRTKKIILHDQKRSKEKEREKSWMRSKEIQTKRTRKSIVQ